MRLTIAIEAEAADAAAEIRDLYRRLRDDPAARQGSTITIIPGTIEPGHMGPVLDVVEFVVGTGFQLAALALALADWRRRRPARACVTIELESGTKIRLDDPDAAERLVRALEQS